MSRLSRVTNVLVNVTHGTNQHFRCNNWNMLHQQLKTHLPRSTERNLCLSNKRRTYQILKNVRSDDFVLLYHVVFHSAEEDILLEIIVLLPRELQILRRV